MQRLKFYYGNAKLPQKIAHFSLAAGHSCPFALKCLAKADKLTGKLWNGSAQEFRCYAASMEVAFPSVRAARWHNFEALRACKTKQAMFELLDANLKFVEADIIRIHVAGDFYNQDYFDAWLMAACKHKDKLFYCYTKALTYWVKRLKTIPKNLKLVASKGGTHDYLIEKHKLRYAEVVHSVEEAAQKRLPIDHDDSIAYKTNKSLALILHGVQSAGSAAAKSLSALRLVGLGGYRKKEEPQLLAA